MRIKPPKRSAAGLPSIRHSMEKALREMGPGRTLSVLSDVNQKDGFDCPGCAWPEKAEHRAHFEFCENGAKAVADEATTKRVGPEFFAAHTIAELRSKPAEWLNAQGRISHPMLLSLGGSHYQSIEWSAAFSLAGAELRALSSPDRAVFYTSGRTSNEAAFLYQLLVRKFGTNNLPDCSNMCHESSGEGLRETIGVGKGTVTLDDFAVADAIFIIGQNPGTNHPRMLSTLQAAARRGCEIVSANPLPEAGLIAFRHPQEVAGILGIDTPLSTLFLPVRINGDVALLQGIAKEMMECEDRNPGTVLDRAFLEQHTIGFDSYSASIRKQEWSDIVESSGLSRDQIQQAAAVAMRAKRTICCWAMGLTQHRNAVANVQEVVNFLLLRGNIGREGAGVCPVRGHSNVQGDRTMGIWERMPDVFLDRLGAEFDFEPPRRHGLDTVAAIRAMAAGEVDVFLGLGGSFLAASPDTELTEAALRRCRLTVHVSTKLNSSHFANGQQALILPCLGRTERDRQAAGLQFVTVENSMGVVSRSEGKLPPASDDLRSEVAIVCGLAQTILDEDWSGFQANYGTIRQRIENVIADFQDYNGRIERDQSFVLPNTARERVFRTAKEKAGFTVHPLPDHALRPGEMLMMTIRSHDQFNTTVYSANDRYRGISGTRRVILLNEADMRDRQIEAGDRLTIHSRSGESQRSASNWEAVPYPIPRGCAATYFPEANVLVAIDEVAARSNTPASKSLVIRLEKS